METLNKFINLDIVQEFYVNNKPKEDSPYARLSWIHGRIVPFDRDAIHAYIEVNYVADPNMLD